MENNESINLSTIVALKGNQHIIARSLIDKVNSGEETAISMAAKAKFISDTFKEVSESIKPQVIEEVNRYGKEQVTALGGYSVTVKEMGVKYDYSNCQHPQYNRLLIELSKLEKTKKEFEEFLKSIKGHVEIADEETGEMVTIYPPAKQSTTTPVFTFKK